MPLSRQLWATGVPLVVCRSIGFLGYVRLQIKEHCVVEAHPDNEAPDLRLDQPWPALRTHLDKVDVSNLGTKERSHVPALTILYFYMQKYKQLHGSSLPKTRSEKDELRDMIRSSTPPDGDASGALEENYEQAVRLVNVCINCSGVPSQIQAILNDERCTNLTSEVSSLVISVLLIFNKYRFVEFIILDNVCSIT